MNRDEILQKAEARKAARMKKRARQKKLTAMLVSALLLVCVAVGGTVAYLITETEDVQNTFTPAKVSCSVEETFENNVKKDVQIKNTGNTDAYIRATYIVTLRDENKNVYGKAPVEGTDYTICIADNTGWIQIGQYYYYSSVVAPGASTGVLIQECMPTESIPEGYTLAVEILADAVQSQPDAAVTEAWDVTVGQITGQGGTEE